MHCSHSKLHRKCQHSLRNNFFFVLNLICFISSNVLFISAFLGQCHFCKEDNEPEKARPTCLLHYFCIHCKFVLLYLVNRGSYLNTFMMPLKTNKIIRHLFIVTGQWWAKKINAKWVKPLYGRWKSLFYLFIYFCAYSLPNSYRWKGLFGNT